MPALEKCSTRKLNSCSREAPQLATNAEVVGTVEAGVGKRLRWVSYTIVVTLAPMPSSANQGDVPSAGRYRKLGTALGCPSQASRRPSVDGDDQPDNDGSQHPPRCHPTTEMHSKKAGYEDGVENSNGLKM